MRLVPDRPRRVLRALSRQVPRPGTYSLASNDASTTFLIGKDQQAPTGPGSAIVRSFRDEDVGLKGATRMGTACCPRISQLVTDSPTDRQAMVSGAV